MLHEQPIFAREERLPIDPSTAVPDGYEAGQRDQPGGFIGDPDVMDTWATSSLSPQIAGHWVDDPDLFARVFPMDLRPQAHDIIRTWLFSTVVRSHYEHGVLPWANAAISGFVIDPDRKKLSKSAGNNPDDPNNLIAEYGADAVRYWAAGGRPGQDTALDRNVFKVGRRLAIKLLNASRFALGLGEPGDAGTRIDQPLDVSMLTNLAAVVREATDAFDQYNYTKALEVVETFFWSFCDDHLELVKGRAYGAFGEPAQASAQAALRLALDTMLRLFAPFLPFVTEEIWSWWRDGSVHRAAWPQAGELLGSSTGDPLVSETAAMVLAEVRKAKTAAKRSMRWEVDHVLVRGPQARIDAFGLAADDVKEAGRIASIDCAVSEELAVDVVLSEAEQTG